MSVSSSLINKGYQQKWDDGSYFYKKDSPGNRESNSEVIASAIGSYLNWYVLPQELVQPGTVRSPLWDVFGQTLTVSLATKYVYKRNYKTWQTKFSSNSCSGIERYNMLLDVSVRLNPNLNLYDLKDYFKKLFSLDYLLVNPDRHLNNIAFTLTETGFVPSPMFDFGKSLGATKDISRSFNPMFIKPEPLVKSFRKQLNIVGTDYLPYFAYIEPSQLHVPDYVRNSREFTVFLDRLDFFRRNH